MISRSHISKDHCYLNDSLNVEQNSYNSSGMMPNSENLNTKIANDVAEKLLTPKIIYLPTNEYCTEHTDMFLHKDEKLVKPGDKFDSHNDFIQYLNENAKRWHFYYKCSDSRKPNTENESYLYTCVYLKNKEKYVKKGLRKRTNNIKTNCPCKIKLRHLPNEKQLTVLFVCNHHDHPLSEEEFFKLQHGRRLPPYIKEEIMDLLTLNIDIEKIKKYVKMQTGFNMNRTFFYQIERTMRLKNLERKISHHKLIELTQKFCMIEKNCFEENETNYYTIEKNPENMDLCTKIKHEEDAQQYRKNQNMKRKMVKKNSKAGKYNKINKQSDATHNLNNNEEVQKTYQEPFECKIKNNFWFNNFKTPPIAKSKIINENNVTHIITNSLQSQNYNDTEINNFCSPNSQEILVPETNITIDDCLNDNYVAYETVVTEIVNDNFGTDYTQTVECIDNERIITKRKTEGISDAVRLGLNDCISNEIEINNEHIGLDAANNQEITDYRIESALDSTDSTCNVEVKNIEVAASRQQLMPVFDVYMKDGNVTGFVVNEDVVNNLKHTDAVDKDVQTDELNVTTGILTTCENNIVHEYKPESYVEQVSNTTYQKHDYVHKYNIDYYMEQPHFPTYIEMLSQETQINVSQMVKNVRNEKAMFKITTTQRGKEGDTRIWYLTIRFQ